MISTTKPLMVALGKHVIVECYDCDRTTIDTPECLETIMLEAANASGATVLSSHFHTFDPQGVSGVIVIAESHITVHSWPEHRYAAVDIFTCGEKINIEAALDVLRRDLHSSEVFVAEDLDRGIVSPRDHTRFQSRFGTPRETTLSWEQKYQLENAWGILTSLDIHHCNPELIRDADHVRKFAVDLCEHIEMRRFGETVVVNFGEDERVAGFSLVQLIETSLISGHFANQTNHAYIDIFSCKYYHPEAAAQFSRAYFEGQDVTLNVTYRK